MAFGGLLALGAFLFGDSIKTEAQRRSMSQAVQDSGMLINTDYGTNKRAMRELFVDWEVDKKMFPPEYIDFFKVNKSAREDFIVTKVEEAEMAAGFRPYTFHGENYNPKTYDPMAIFLRTWGKAIEDHNKRTEKFRNK